MGRPLIRKKGPMPGITYWRTVTVMTPQGERQVRTPVTRPLASVDFRALRDQDIAALLYVLQGEQERRRTGENYGGAATNRALEQVLRVNLPPGADGTVGPYVPPELYEDAPLPPPAQRQLATWTTFGMQIVAKQQPPPLPEQLAREAMIGEMARHNPPLPDATGADEIARQIAECLWQCRDLGIDDIRAAIDRRFGPPRPTG
jgi:hypothetical protein